MSKVTEPKPPGAAGRAELSLDDLGPVVGGVSTSRHPQDVTNERPAFVTDMLTPGATTGMKMVWVTRAAIETAAA
jgi:hypothetical protein